jgi:23S rRNA (cytidine1920-2'-O)/16S rRNA (cytidine1409-2'-O)-methyltransferase
MPRGQRLDLLLLEKGLFKSRQKATTAIMEGFVVVDGVKVTKPGQSVPPGAKVELVPSYQESKYVSRGGLKLEHAITTFQVPVAGRVCLDVGASTGGFTDCLLKFGAQKVYAVDVGYGQLDWSLRNDSRVVVVERCNARYLKTEEIYRGNEQIANFGCVDVSFISLKLLFGPCRSLLDANGSDLICLVKPQFEAGRESVGKKGVVYDLQTHLEVVASIAESAYSSGFSVLNLTHSPVKGPAGNIEFLLHLATVPSDRAKSLTQSVIESAVRHAHDFFATKKGMTDNVIPS